MEDHALTALITIIGLTLTFLVGLANIIVTIHNARKSTYVNTITTARIKYIQDLREVVSNFCAMAASKNNRQNLPLDNKEYLQLEIEANKLKYLLWLHLNPEDNNWDEKMIELVDDIHSLYLRDLKDMGDLIQKLEDLRILTQYLLKYEWEGAKFESKRGIITTYKKNKLYEKNLKQYEKYIENLHNKLPRKVRG